MYVRTYVHLYFSLPSLPFPFPLSLFPSASFSLYRFGTVLDETCIPLNSTNHPLQALRGLLMVCVHVRMCVYVCMYVCTCKHLYVHTIRVCLYVRTSVCLCVCVFMYVRRSLRVVYEVSTHACHAVQSHNPQTIGLKYHNAPNTTTHLVFLNCCL